MEAGTLDAAAKEDNFGFHVSVVASLAHPSICLGRRLLLCSLLLYSYRQYDWAIRGMNVYAEKNKEEELTSGERER